MPQKKDVLKNKHQKKRQVKGAYRYQTGNYGPDDGKVKLPKYRGALLDIVTKEELEQEFVENQDIKFKSNKNGKV